MKTICLQLFSILLLISNPLALHGQQQNFSEEDKTAIKKLIQQTETYNNASDVDKWVNLFADDAVYMPPGSPAVTTRKELIETAKAGFKHQASISIEPIEINGNGDWAFARTKVTGEVNVFDSKEVVTVDVKQIVIYTREPDCQWRIARLISNSNTQ
ncbi:YybH family protein [Fodinibius salsisoli]|uniref:Nuclear transport factor 2 family protein n=1 Tax=Fodinibius salsisoli TaxID=2820877 RepID=A0ABT3PQ75_9BACT|nr:nuclear transport factor 2 family protein [Fodinibius salsisoli]MCW9708018.1 nuclear transport factor 2 family protein [Fodinibius salsisoli]